MIWDHSLTTTTKTMRDLSCTSAVKAHLIVAALCGLVLNPYLVYVATGDTSDWTRGFMGTPRDDDTPLVRCEMITVRSTNGHLTGDLLFINETESTIELTGAKISDGKLWPQFTPQVTDEGDHGWRTIRKSEPCGAAKITIRPYSEQEIHVDLDSFHPMIGKVTYGRVLFENGVWTMFDLSLFAH